MIEPDELPTPTVHLDPTIRRTLERIADIVKEITIIEATIAAALNQLQQSTGGYATTTPGASTAQAQPPAECRAKQCTNTLPCELHDPAVQLTPTERLAGQSDKARADLDLIIARINRIHRDAPLVATLSQRWGTASIDAGTVRKRLSDALSTIWCNNCAANGFNRKRTNGDHCEFCSGIKSRYKRYPNHQLCAMNDAGRRVMPSDVGRAFKKADKPEPYTPSTIDAGNRRTQRLEESA